MDHHRFRFRKFLQACLKRRSFLLQDIHLGFHAGMVHAVGDCRDDAIDFLTHLDQALLDAAARRKGLRPVFLYLALKFRDELGHEVRRHQLIP
ncbi:MAG: hypothetical protein ABI832_19560 [bacterium]